MERQEWGGGRGRGEGGCTMATSVRLTTVWEFHFLPHPHLPTSFLSLPLSLSLPRALQLLAQLRWKVTTVSGGEGPSDRQRRRDDAPNFCKSQMSRRRRWAVTRRDSSLLLLLITTQLEIFRNLHAIDCTFTSSSSDSHSGVFLTRDTEEMKWCLSLFTCCCNSIICISIISALWINSCKK